MEDTAVESSAVVTHVEPISVYATDPQGLQNAHGDLRAWAVAKVTECKSELEEQEAILQQAIRGHWGRGRIERLINRGSKRLLFYEKIVMALDAGYLVIPNMPMDTIAIRTTRKKPSGAPGSTWTSFAQTGQLLPVGEGEFKNPIPRRELYSEEYEEKGVSKTRDRAIPDAWRELEFPIELANPQLIEKANQALSKKLFDELGFVRDASNSRGDPILVGRLRNPITNRLDVTFFLGWRLDTRRI